MKISHRNTKDLYVYHRLCSAQFDKVVGLISANLVFSRQKLGSTPIIPFPVLFIKSNMVG